MGREPIAALEARTGSSPARLEGACRACRRRRLTTCSVPPAVEWHDMRAACSWTVLSPLRRRCAAHFALAVANSGLPSWLPSEDAARRSRPVPPFACARSARRYDRRRMSVRSPGTCASGPGNSRGRAPAALPAMRRRSFCHPAILLCPFPLPFPSPCLCSCFYGGLLVCF